MGSRWRLVDEAERARLIDVGGHVRPVRNRAFGVLGLATFAVVPWVGWWPVLPLGIALLGFLVNERLMPRLARPERSYMTAWLLAQSMIAIVVAATGGTESWALGWFAVPVVILATRLTVPGVALGVGATVVLLALAVGLAPTAGGAARPEVLIGTLALVIGAGFLSIALLRSDLQHREEAIVDPLTQALNRGALHARAREIEAQSAHHPQPVAVVIGDIDRFKAVNDTLGHAAGDAVLREVAYRLRTQLRAYDAVYRLGGEEFLVLLPGGHAAGAAALAEALRVAVREQQIVGRTITMSFGVAATAAGEAFRLEQLLAAADAELYQAKAAGRDRVGGMLPGATRLPDCAAGPSVPLVAAAAVV